MQNKQRFFKTETNHAPVSSTTHLALIQLNGRGDYAISIALIDKFLSTQYNKLDELARVLLTHASCEFKRLKSDDLLTPSQYMRSLCLKTDPHLLIGSIATVLNHIAIETILKNPIHFQDLIIQRPDALINIEKKPSQLNPWIAQALNLSLPISVSIDETKNNRTIPKYIAKTSPGATSLMISKHQEGNTSYLAANIKLSSHFKGLTASKIQPCVFSQALINSLEMLIETAEESIKAHQIDLKERFGAIKLRLQKYVNKEAVTEEDLINIYTQALSSRVNTYSSEISKLMLSDGFPQTKQTSLSDELKEAIAAAIARGELNDFTRKLQHHAAMPG